MVFSLLNNKKAVKKLGIGLVLLALAGMLFITLLPQTQTIDAASVKSAQTYLNNYTCEEFIDSVTWSAVAPKTGFTLEYYNWTVADPCPGVKNCDIINISNYYRIINAGATASPAGDSFVQIGNTTQSIIPDWTRYSVYDIGILAGELRGPEWGCGNDTSPDVCNTAGQGYNSSTTNYSIKVSARGGGTNKYRTIVDVFNVKYKWCWIPIILDANISSESQTYENTFNFTIKVTNPDANTTVQLWTRPVGGTWEQKGVAKYCANCSALAPYSNGELSWEVTFDSGDVGNNEFKFNATDDAGYNQTAWASGSTNECLDSGNDCVFTISAPEAGGSSGGAGAAITPTPSEREDVKEPFAFEVNVEVLPKYKEILLEDTIVVADILIESIGTEKEVKEVNLEYFIENSRGRTFFIEKEQINLDTETILLRDIEISEDLGIGTYWFVAKVSYKETGASGKDNFYVVEEKGLIEPKAELPKMDIITLIILLLLLILILVIIRAFVKKKRNPKVIHIYHHHDYHRARRAKKILKAAKRRHAKESRKNRFLEAARDRRKA